MSLLQLGCSFWPRGILDGIPGNVWLFYFLEWRRAQKRESGFGEYLKFKVFYWLGVWK